MLDIGKSNKSKKNLYCISKTKYTTTDAKLDIVYNRTIKPNKCSAKKFHNFKQKRKLKQIPSKMMQKFFEKFQLLATSHFANLKKFITSKFSNVKYLRNHQLRMLLLKTNHCVKGLQIRSFFWSVFSRIRTEYGDLWSKSLYSVHTTAKYEPGKLRIWTLFTQ